MAVLNYFKNWTGGLILVKSILPEVEKTVVGAHDLDEKTRFWTHPHSPKKEFEHFYDLK